MSLTKEPIFFKCKICHNRTHIVPCNDCRLYICNNCSLIYEKIPYHLIGLRHPGNIYCIKCDIEIEKKLIDVLNREELPLYINTEWMTKEAEEHYKKVLQEVSI